MASDATQYRVTPYLIYLVFVTTLGPLQFGYHLVRNESLQVQIPLIPVHRPSSMLPRQS